MLHMRKQRTTTPNTYAEGYRAAFHNREDVDRCTDQDYCDGMAAGHEDYVSGGGWGERADGRRLNGRA